VKNLSSIRSLVNAIEFEVTRQISLLEGGQSIINETRGYDAVTKQTVPMRDKEVQQVNIKYMKLNSAKGVFDDTASN